MASRPCSKSRVNYHRSQNPKFLLQLVDEEGSTRPGQRCRRQSKVDPSTGRVKEKEPFQYKFFFLEQ